MNNLLHLRLALVALLACLPGCLLTQSGSLEVLNPKQAYGRSVAVVGDLHGENEAIEQRLASDLRQALARSGLEVAGDPSDAEIVIVPTLGRMRERAPQPVVAAVEPVEVEGGEPVVAEEPVIAAAAPQPRPFNRFASANIITRGDLVSRRAVPSARTPPSAQRAGLLLTGYRGEDFRDYGTGRQSLPPVWHIYVSQPAGQMKWNTVAVPLINAAASAAKPLAKSREQGAGSREQGARSVEQEEAGDRSHQRSNESRESRAERTADGPEANRLESSDSRAAGSPAGEINTKDQTTEGQQDEEAEKKGFLWFGRKDKTES